MRARPGLALGIVHGDRIVHVQGFGQADRYGQQVTPQTPFLIGSVTKSFTALAIMQLSEAGRVQLDAPVQRYLPWWRVADPDASTRSRSAICCTRSAACRRRPATPTRPASPRVRPRGPGPGAANAQLTQPVGTTWQYSNANYWTLGVIVQAVSGQSYKTYIQQHIFDPLQMRNSYTSHTRRSSTDHPPSTATGTAPGRRRTALRSRRPGFRRPQLQRAGHGPLPRASTSTTADTAPQRWSHRPAPRSCSGQAYPPAWTASPTRWAGT